MNKHMKWGLVSAALALTVGTISLLHQGTPVAAATQIRVGSYNLRAPKKNDTNLQRSLLQNDHVEIAGLQEINYNNHRFSGKTTYNTLTNFKNSTYPETFFGNAITFAGGGYGIATLSSLPLAEKQNHHIYSDEAGVHEKTFKKLYKAFRPDQPATSKALDKLTVKYGTKLVEPRIYQRVVITKDGQQIAFYNTHLSYESTKIRTKQFKVLAKTMLADPVKYQVLVGDFNCDQNTKEWQLFAKHFNLANGQDGLWRDTFIGDDPTMNVNSIDNIITSKNITISNVHTIKSTASDHIPLVADLTLN